MKTFPWRTVLTLSLFTIRHGFGQVVDTSSLDTSQSTTSPSPSIQTAASDWQGTPIDWVSTEWKKTEIVTNTVPGGMKAVTRRYIEISSGLNFITDKGSWARSADLIQVTTNSAGQATGASALQGPTKVFFSPTIGEGDATLTMISASNTVIKISPVAVYYIDDSTGKSVLLASVRNGAEGELVGVNQLVYRSAIVDGLK